MSKFTRMATLCPAIIGAMIGVELMLSMFSINWRGQFAPQTAADLTSYGAWLFRPEYDLQVYVAGSLLTGLLIVGLSWIQRRQASGPEAGTPERAANLYWSQLLLCAMLFLLHPFILRVTSNLFMEDNGDLPLPASANLLMLPALSAFIFCGWRKSSLPFSRWFGCHPADAAPAPPAVRHRWLDLVIPLAVLAVVYIPDVASLAVQIFHQDYFHHWDYYAMGPALALRHGAALGTAAYSQYGVGWPLLFRALDPLLPLSYEHLLRVSMIYGCAYFVGVYFLLALLLRSRPWAAAGLFLVLTLQLFSGVGEGTLWTYPSSTILRAPLDVWFFFCILRHVRTAQTRWLYGAAALAGGGILFGTDTGVYLCVTLAAYLVYGQSLPRTSALAVRRQVWLALQCAALALLVVLPVLWIAGRGTLLQRGFWAGWLEALLSFGGGFGLMPMRNVELRTLWLFMLATALSLGAIGLAVLRMKSRYNTPENVFLATLGTYGLAAQLLFIGRSHPFNFYHVAVPFGIMAAAILARWSHSWTPPKRRSDPPAGTAPTRVPGGLLQHGSWSAWAAQTAALLLLLTNRAFHKYPGLGRPGLPRTPVVGGGLPVDAPGGGAMFVAVVGKMKASIASGNTVAVLDDTDTIFYLAADASSWSRYSPLFPALYTRTAVAELVQDIATRGPDVVVIRDSPAHAWCPFNPDAWRAVHVSLGQHYRLEGTVGFFEFWRRGHE
ncbi:MAG: hypothetical protein ACOYOU_07525 [Kiritimatiellia bacterium]